ncbi:unnamed protein product [Prunus armeniaca]
MVEEQLGWEKLIVRFIPTLEINLDTSGLSSSHFFWQGMDIVFPIVCQCNFSPSLIAVADAEGSSGGVAKDAEQSVGKGAELWMRQGLAIRTVKLISVEVANLDDFIGTFPCCSEGTFS